MVSLFGSKRQRLFFKKNNCIYLFLERGKWRRKRGRETSMCGCLPCTSYWGPGPHPRHVPWLGIDLATGLQASTQSTEPHQLGQKRQRLLTWPKTFCFLSPLASCLGSSRTKCSSALFSPTQAISPCGQGILPHRSSVSPKLQLSLRFEFNYLFPGKPLTAFCD